MVSSVLLVASSTFGARKPSLHTAAIALEAAIAEARSVATMQQADGTDAKLPTGATVSVAIDSRDTTRSIIRVYRSRPIPNPNKPIYALIAITSALPLDNGFPSQDVPAVFSVKQDHGRIISGSFTILVASSGLTSIEPGAYELGKSFGPLDPGCSDVGTSIAAASGAAIERHPFNCRNASYDASVGI